MTQEQIYNRLTQVFRNVFDDDSIRLSPATTAADIPDWDSLSHTSLIAATEARFGVKFKTAELESLRNVGHFVDVISCKVA